MSTRFKVNLEVIVDEEIDEGTFETYLQNLIEDGDLEIKVIDVGAREFEI